MRWIGVLAVVTFAAVGFRSAEGSPPTAAGVGRAMDATWAKYRSHLVGLCVGAVDSGVEVVKCYGRERPGENLQPNPDTLFAIGSLTKDFTATLLALRVDQGKVGLHDPARKYIPIRDGRAMVPPSLTLLDLADHFSGLPRTPAPRATVTSVDDLNRDFAACISDTGCRHDVPGNSFVYSNFAFAVLGQLLGASDGFVAMNGYSGWEADDNAAITQPLGMTKTKTASFWNASEPRYFAAHKAFGREGSTTISDPQIANPEWSDPAGALYSSSRDMLTWLRFNLGLTGPAQLKATLPLLYADRTVLRPRGTNPNKEIGLSWNVDKAAGSACVWKSGSVQGFQSYMVFIPGKKLGDFVLLNSRGGSAPDPSAMGTDLINVLPPAPVPSQFRQLRCPAKGAVE
ncbi:MAG TPA: serine hydrolase domain-containing protein [Gaiellaceae bacterium]|nr:serine hydrolase domain-containing protein [Gaiellaceae bacterium]